MPNFSRMVASEVSTVNLSSHIPPPPVLLTTRQFAEKHIGFSQGALRGLIFNSKSRQSSAGEITGNGLNGALVRIGRKLLINEQKFYQWLRSVALTGLGR